MKLLSSLKKYTFLAAVIIIAVSACSQTGELNDSLYDERTAELRNQLRNDSTDFDLLKEYSVLLVLSKKNDEAVYYIEKALNLSPKDPVLLFNKGLNYEFLNDTINAVKSYSEYAIVDPSSQYREMMHGRYLLLNRELIKNEVRNSVEKENIFAQDEISESNIAIFPMDYIGQDPKYSALSSGFSEMISIDLGKVKELKVLERIRLKTVLDELKFGQSKFVDRKTAPRVGKILSAGKLYDGIINIDEENDIQIELSYWDIIKNVRSEAIKRDGDITDLFLLEKEIVFHILRQLNIELTPFEREEIEYIPTENINAFLAYSRGLELEEEGSYEQAASFFNTAVEIDPSFSGASNKIIENNSKEAGKGSKETMLESVGNNEFGGSFQSNMIDERLNKLSQTISSNFGNSIDSRKPAQESEKGIYELPPPPPPNR
jgi:tetratricopeptide (TPR) repeat protein